MNAKSKGTALGRWAGCFVATLAASLMTGMGAEGTITTKEGRTFTGQIQWKSASRVYEVQQANSVKMTIAPDKVAKIQTKPPAELDGAINNVKAGRYANAIPALKQVADAYAMLEHDITASRWLAEAYLKTGDAKNAVAICEKLLRDTPDAVASDDFARIYTDALLADEQYAKLKDILTRIVQSGSRPACAVAQLKRGDIEMKKGNHKDALLDGYLRTAVLFEDQKQVQPEALYKAALCFDQIGQTPYAEKMRKKLLAEYPQDPYSEKIKSGQ